MFRQTPRQTSRSSRRGTRAGFLAACSLIAVAAAAPLAAQPAPKGPMIWDAFSMQSLSRFLAQTAILSLRSTMDLTYEAMTVSPDGREVGLTGLVVHLPLPDSPEGTCPVSADRLDISNRQVGDNSRVHLDFTGVSAPLSCLPEEAAGGVSMVGYDAIIADLISVDLAYEMGSSAFDFAMQAALRNAGAISVEANFDYVWLRENFDGDDPVPVAILRAASISYEEGGLIGRIRPIVPPEAFDFDAADAIVGGFMRQALSEGGQRPLSPEESQFVDAAAAAVKRLLNEGGRLTIAAAPDQPMRIDENTLDAFEDPAAAITALSLTASAAPSADPATLLSGADLAEAIQGGALAGANRRAAGLALLTGVGAPRATATGAALLAPLAREDVGVAAALAQALADRDPEAAYAHALFAAGGGADGAPGMRDSIEAGLSTAAILRAQDEAEPTTAPLDAAMAAAASGGLPGLRTAALAAAAGLDEPRSYSRAYLYATLAAASGDAASAALRDRIARRLTQLGPEDWRKREALLDAAALDVWTRGELVAALTGPAR